jgi:hypothetical protein
VLQLDDGCPVFVNPDQLDTDGADHAAVRRDRDGLCDVSDIIAANIEIFSPTSTSICTRQPVPGP